MASKREFNGLETGHTYATFANATRALENACTQLGIPFWESVNYVIAATPAGRFYPVILPDAQQIQLACLFAQLGIRGIRR